jgi:hypothetical protein
VWDNFAQDRAGAPNTRFFASQHGLQEHPAPLAAVVSADQRVKSRSICNKTFKVAFISYISKGHPTNSLGNRLSDVTFLSGLKALRLFGLNDNNLTEVTAVLD